MFVFNLLIKRRNIGLNYEETQRLRDMFQDICLNTNTPNIITTWTKSTSQLVTIDNSEKTWSNKSLKGDRRPQFILNDKFKH